MMVKSVASTLAALLLLAAVATQRTQAEPVNLYGLNYNSRKGPDWDPFKCKTQEEIDRDLTVLSRMTPRIRLLSLTDCMQGEMVYQAAKKVGLKLWLGLWVGEAESVFEDEYTELEAMIGRGDLDDDTVLGVTVGSEALYRGEVTVGQLIANRNRVKDLVMSMGFTLLPVAITEVGDTYRNYTQLFSHTDAVVANEFPFWEVNVTTIDTAVDYLFGTKIPALQYYAKPAGVEVIIGETGWATSGENRAAQPATQENQQKFFQDFYCRSLAQNTKYFYFTAFDNTWRSEQDQIPNWVEPHFGLMYDDLQLKEVYRNWQFSCPGLDATYSFELGEIPAPPPPEPEMCSAHPDCAALPGLCCPATSGQFLDCCTNIPAQSTPALTPVTTPAPTPFTSALGSPLTTNSPTPFSAGVPVGQPADDTTLAPASFGTPPVTSAPNTGTTTDQTEVEGNANTETDTNTNTNTNGGVTASGSISNSAAPSAQMASLIAAIVLSSLLLMV